MSLNLELLGYRILHKALVINFITAIYSQLALVIELLVVSVMMTVSYARVDEIIHPKKKPSDLRLSSVGKQVGRNYCHVQMKVNECSLNKTL